MKIDGWQIEGFGIFRDCEVRGLAPGLTVFLGPNEAGKSTLLAFLRGVLFGFPGRRSRAAQYPPLAGGRHGGRILLCGARGEAVIERIAGRRGGPRINGEEAGPQELQALLGGADESLFCSVFAFSLSEMQTLEWIQADEVRERIFSAGIAGAGVSARLAIDRLEEEAASLYRKRGASRAKEISEQIDRAERQLRAAESDSERYVSFEQEQERWTAVAAELSGREQSLRERLRSVEAALEVHAELERARAELAALPEAPDLPDEPELPLAELGGRVEAGRARAKLAATVDEKLGAIAGQVETLRSRVELHRDRILSLKALPRPRGLVSWIAAGTALAFAGGLLTARGRIAAGLAALAAGLFAAALVLYRRAARNTAAHSLEASIAEWEEAAREVLGVDYSGERLAVELLGLAERCRQDQLVRAKLAALDEAAGGVIDVTEAEEALASFRRNLRASRKRREARSRIAALEQKIAAGSLPEWTLEAAGLRPAIAEAQAERDRAVGARSVAEAELERIGESAAIPAIRTEIESLRAELAGCVHEWRVATLAAELVSRALGEFTHKRQPAVLEEASASFARVTDGVYRRIVQDESGQSLIVLDSGGRAKRPEDLSRGTAEQLYLCLRLALAAEFARRTEALPLIMDDVLVNFDPGRARAVARELVASSATRQILLFTCHPETARIFEEIAPGVDVLAMDALRSESAGA